MYVFTYVAGSVQVCMCMVFAATQSAGRGAVDGRIFDKPRAYMLFCYNGSLVGSGKDNSSGTAYHKQRIPAGSTVRCVRDRAARTVAFTIDGHCPGVAFADVPDGDLFFACNFYSLNDCIEIAA